jgi:hypothetical protein
MNARDLTTHNFPVILPISLMGLWLLISAVVSYIGGWFSLSRGFRAQDGFKGPKWKFQSGQMRWRTNYGSILTLGANQDGLYLAVMPLFRFMHPPLLVPWNEIKVRRSKGWLFEYVTFLMGHEASIPLKVLGKVASKLRHVAGSGWPIEET